MNPLTIDVVIVTRNRPAALSLSLPLVLSQSFRPQQVIVVDSGEAAPVAAVIADARRSSKIPIVALRSLPGIPVQRNVGLGTVTADVVLFLDDDSLLLPNAISAIMRIYQLDQEQTVGGVCSREATLAPAVLLKEAKNTYKMTALDSLRLKVAKQRYLFEAKMFPDPLFLHGRSLLSIRAVPSWLESENGVPVEYMTGFRMSFRTKLIKQCGFDETLSGYALFEDTDASFCILKTHLLVGARNAEIFHYKDPGRRGTGRSLGVAQVLNMAYVVCRHSSPGSEARSHLRSFLKYKIVLYATAFNTAFGRERFLGALRAYRCIHYLELAPPEELAEIYCQLRAKCLVQQ